jgi:hypothetical protein
MQPLRFAPQLVNLAAGGTATDKLLSRLKDDIHIRAIVYSLLRATR